MDDEKGSMPTPSSSGGEDVKQTPAKAASTTDDAAKQTLKDLINVTNEWVSINPEGVDGDGNDGGDDTDDNNSAHPIRKVVEDTVMSVRGGIDAHVAPRVQEFVQRTAQLHEQHIAPHLDKAGRAVQEMGSSTKTAIDAHIEKVKESSTWALTGVQIHSARAVEGVKEHSTRSLEGVKYHSARAIENVQVGTKAVLDTHVTPKVDEFVKHSSRAIDETGKHVGSFWSHLSHLVVSNRPYYWGTAPALMNGIDAPWYLIVEEATCRAYGRVVFCNNPVTGICIWLAVLLASPLAGLCSLLSVLMVNLTALYLEMDRPTLQGGMYAYNAVLIGTGLIDYFKFDFKVGGLTAGWPVAIFMSIVLSPITLISGLYIQQKLLGGITYPFLHLPFNIVMFGVLLCAKLWDSTMITQVVLTDEEVLDDMGDTDATRFIGYQVLFNSLSRTFLVNGVIPGVLILIGTFMCSRILSLSLVAGAFFSSILSLVVFDENTTYLNAGYAGYNSSLTVAGIFYYFVPSWKLTGLAFFWIMVTMISQAVVGVVLDALSIPVAMTFGFVIALLPLLSIDPDKIFSEGSFIRHIPFLELSTPEEYLQSVAPLLNDNEDAIKDVQTADTMEGVEYGGDMEDAAAGEGIVSEATPLLSSPMS